MGSVMDDIRSDVSVTKGDNKILMKIYHLGKLVSKIIIWN